MNMNPPDVMEGDIFPLPASSSRGVGGEKGQSLLKRLSARHHRLAQCLADGIPPGEAGVICGYVASRVSILQNDSAFKELISFYAAKRQEAFIETGMKLADVASTALDILQERLEEKPDDVSIPNLIAIATTALDRSGHGPSSTQKTVSVNVSAEDLERLKQQVFSTQPGSVKLLPSQSDSRGGEEGGTGPGDANPEAGSSPEGPEV